MTTLPIVPPNVSALAQHDSAAQQRLADRYYSSAHALAIDNEDDYQLAASELVSVKQAAAELETKRKTLTDPLHQLKTAIHDLFRPAQTRLEEAEKHLKGMMSSYLDREAAARLKAQEAAEAKAREEAEQARLQAQALTEKAERARSAGKREELLAAAAEAEEKAYVAELAPVPQQDAPSAAGVGSRKKWVLDEVDLATLVKAAAADPQYLIYLVADEKKLSAMGRAASGTLSIPGVKFRPETVIAASRRG